jgi:hypothetical protein
MSNIEVHDMDENTQYFVSTCSHVNESKEADACGERRLAWFKKMHDKGFRVNPQASYTSCPSRSAPGGLWVRTCP